MSATTVARLGGLLALGIALGAAAQAIRNASSGVYTTAQAARGKQAYTAHCASCHGPLMEGIDAAPPLTGSRFRADWLNQPSDGLFTRIKATMPQNDPGSLGSRTVADIMAYMFQINGFPAGSDSLPTSTDDLQLIRIDSPEATAR